VPHVDSPLIIGCSALYLGVCILIGLWSIRRTKTSSDFFIAGRRLGVFVMVIAMNASIMSGLGFIGGPGIVFASGTTSLWLALAIVGGAVALFLVGKPLRLMAEVREVLTLPDAVQARYGGRWPQAAMALAMLLGVVGYMGTQILALGMVVTAVFGLDLTTGMLLGLGVLLFYSVAGGMVAAIYTDLFQGAVMTAAALAVSYYASTVGGGWSEMTRTLWEMDPEFIGPWGTMGPLAALSWYLLGALGIAGQPQAITKYLMLRDVRSLKWSAVLAVGSHALVTVIWLTVGIAMRYLVESGLESPLASPDLATPVFLLNHTPPLVAGLALAGVLGAIMSTSDSFLNLGAAAVIRDIPKALLGRPCRRELFWSRIATAVLLVVSAVFALYIETLTALLGTFGAGTFAAAIVPSIAIGFNWKRATGAACTSSILVSLVLNFTLEVLNRHDVYTLPNGLFVGTFSLLVSIIVFIVVSFMGSRGGKSSLPPDIAAVMEV
jgi:sodium/proline symporter